MRGVVAGLAQGAVVLEEGVERQAVRLQVRVIAAIPVLIQKFEWLQNSAAVFL